MTEMTREEFDGALADAGLYECDPLDHNSDPGCDSCIGVQKAKAYADQEAEKLDTFRRLLHRTVPYLGVAAILSPDPEIQKVLSAVKKELNIE